MKNLVFALFAGIIVFSGCSDTVTETVTYMINEPVFMSADQFRSSVKVAAQPVTISNYGKMCFYDGYIYISETEKGIHIIDNRNPANPQNIGFIELMGNADLAIRNGKLYADSFIDLVWFDISNPAMPELEGRLESVFIKYMPLPQTGNEYGIDYNLCYGMNGAGKGIVVGWELKKRTETYTYENRRGWWRGNHADMMYSNSGTASSGGSVGINGSMSRFALYRDHLYSVINNYMNIIDLSGEEPRKAAEDIYIGWNVETIFSYRDNMFMGTPTGMVIYSVADPVKPEYMSMVRHVFGCDPVVVENDIAYVTIHADNFCGQNNNDLLIHNVSNVRQPRHIATYAMTKPKGLGIDNGTLFVCDDGLKIFNASDPQKLMGNRLAHYSGMDGFDVIPFNNVLMMIADDGLYQYDYSDLEKITQLSKLPIVKK
jgi:hypothetical protein